MATVVRRYRKTRNITDSMLSDVLPAGAFVSSVVPRPGEIVDISLNNTITNYAADSDAALSGIGFTFVSEGPVTSQDVAAASEVPPINSVLESGGTVLPIGSILDGYLFTRVGASLVGTQPDRPARKTANQTISANNTTLVDDTELQYSVVVSNYMFEFEISGNNAAVAEGIKVSLAGSLAFSNLIADVMIFTHNTPGVIATIGRMSAFGSPIGAAIAAAGNFTVRISGLIEVTSPGTFILRWAKQASTGTTTLTVLRGSKSWMKTVA